jgi:hypothetical protein
MSERTTTKTDSIPAASKLKKAQLALILEKIFELNNVEFNDFKEQFKSSKLLKLDDYGSVGFEINSEVKSAELQNGTFSVHQEDTNTVRDAGPFINLIAFVRDGKLIELQIYKDDGGQIIRQVKPELFFAV